MTNISFQCDDSADDKVTMKVDFTDGDWWAIDFTAGRISIFRYSANKSTGVNLS